MDAEKEIVVNGERRIFAAGATLLDVVRSLDLEPARVAIELNREIIRRDLWATAIPETGAGLEIVMFVGGG